MDQAPLQTASIASLEKLPQCEPAFSGEKPILEGNMCFKRMAAAVATGLMLAAICSAASAQNSVSMNSGKVASGSSADLMSKDSRLSKKINYNSGYQRLYYVADDLKSLSGISIGSGTTKSNWQVRDIPVIVSAKDVPLGILLNTIANCTHLQLSVATSDTDKSKIYKFIRTSNILKDYDKSVDASSKAELDDAEWCWNVVAEFGKTASIGMADVPMETSILSKLIYQLGEQGKQKVFNGERIVLNTKGSQYEAMLSQLYVVASSKVRSNNFEVKTPDGGSMKLDNPSTEDIDKSALTIKMMGYGDNGFPSAMQSTATVMISMSPFSAKSGEGNTSMMVATNWSTNLSEQASICYNAIQKNKAKYNDIPDRPVASAFADRSKDVPDEPWVPLADSKLAELDANISLNAPKNTDKLTYGDLITAISKASGLNFVCEDFGSQLMMDEGVIKGGFRSNVKVRDLLKTLYGFRWFVDEDNKLIMGWTSENWVKKHLALVPESLLVDLNQKLNSTGVQIDDAVQLLLLTSDQRNMWINMSRDYRPLTFLMMSNYIPFWKLYAQLSTEDKQLAKGDFGMPIAQIDPNLLNATLQEVESAPEFDDIAFGIPEEALKQIRGQKDDVLSIFRDPKVADTIVMRLKKSNMGSGMIVGSPSDKDMKMITKVIGDLDVKNVPVDIKSMIQKAMRKDCYALEFEYTKDGSKATKKVDGFNLTFPIYAEGKEPKTN